MGFMKPVSVGAVVLLLLLCDLGAYAQARSLKSRFASLVHSLEKLENLDLAKAFQNTEESFARFLAQHHKNYSGAEYLHRLKIFEDNLVQAAKHQVDDPTAVHGITMFADLTPSEFSSRFLGLKSLKQTREELKSLPKAPLLDTTDLPKNFDWRDYGAVTSVKNQGFCGSCYAFSAVGAIEGAHYLSTGELLDLSEQQVVDCDSTCSPEYEDACDSGCNGGFMDNVFKYVQDAGGLNTAETYPYVGHEGTCNFDPSAVAATSAGYEDVINNDAQIAANLVARGPLAVGLNANWMQTYVKGVSCPIICNKRALNHGVLLVGYGSSGWAIGRLRRLPYWIIKNSWGTGWGEEGYYRICKGKNECGVSSMVSAVVSTAAKPDDAPRVVAAAKAAASRVSASNQAAEAFEGRSSGVASA